MADPATNPWGGIASVDRLVHEPARLAVLGMVESNGGRVDFRFLKAYTGLTAGNLEHHLTKLEEAGLVGIEKGFVGKRPRTTTVLTQEGREALAEWERRMEAFREGMGRRRREGA